MFVMTALYGRQRRLWCLATNSRHGRGVVPLGANCACFHVFFDTETSGFLASSTNVQRNVVSPSFRCSTSLGVYYSGFPEEADNGSGLALIPRSRLSTVACSLVAVTRSRMFRAYTATN